VDLWRHVRLISRSTRIQLSLLAFERDGKSQLVQELQSRRVDVVFDVGANSGQFVNGLRSAGYKGRIVSFEPLSEPFALLKSKSTKDPLWDCRQCALGDLDGTIAINVAGNAGQSSSALPMMEAHQEACPQANYVGTEEVLVHRFDSIAQEFLRPTDVSFLKIDVQGFEKQVLAGGQATLADGCIGMQLELSIVPLYEGGMLIREAIDLAHSLGFTLTALVPGFTDVRNGQMLQADGIFFKQNEDRN
jgi:FkbM family methyltransferase